MKSLSEDRLLAWLRGRLRRQDEDLLGDDGALLDRIERPVVTVDQQIEGVHFPSGLPLDIRARRLLAVNLSDLAAMGAAPRYALLTLALPPGLNPKPLFIALLDACKKNGLILAGGDLATASVFVATLSLIGALDSRSRVPARGNAKPSWNLWLGGSLGESAVGRDLLSRGATIRGRSISLPPLPRMSAHAQRGARRAIRRHLLPRPQMELGRWLASQSEAAAIDISDGFALDLHRLCSESGVGAEIDARALDEACGCSSLARKLALDPRELSLAGGEDYVLLFALPAASEPPEDLHCRRIGTVTKTLEIVLLEDGRAENLERKGWDHLQSESAPSHLS
jgi:thiamine-monophosphate kinase